MDRNATIDEFFGRSSDSEHKASAIGRRSNEFDSFILAMSYIRNYGPVKIFNYLSKNNYEYDRCVSGLSGIRNIDPESFQSYVKKAEKEIKEAADKGIGFITAIDERFPGKLYSHEDKCIFLFYKGDISLLNERSIAVIGTRRPSEQFIVRGSELTRKIIESGFVVVSGLAMGCDTIAHEECLKRNGRTIAVLPSSCNDIYPKTNELLANKIVEKGGLLVSEYGPSSKFGMHNFPQRDRIQSLLSDAVAVIQSEDDGGSKYAIMGAKKDMKYVCALTGNNLKEVSDYIGTDDDSISKLIRMAGLKQRTVF